MLLTTGISIVVGTVMMKTGVDARQSSSSSAGSLPSSPAPSIPAFSSGWPSASISTRLPMYRLGVCKTACRAQLSAISTSYASGASPRSRHCTGKLLFVKKSPGLSITVRLYGLLSQSYSSTKPSPSSSPEPSICRLVTVRLSPSVQSIDRTYPSGTVKVIVYSPVLST